MIDGALLLDKPVGLSSNAALQKAKRLFGAAKAGHAGTLDPLASGLLVVLFGEATKFAAPLLDADKEYVARLKLGETTDTADAEGKLLRTQPVQVSEAQVLAALERFRGEIEQLPPMHSALKHAGVPLYKLARSGKTVARTPRRVEIRSLELISFGSPFVSFRVRCSKGTYVRVLAEDIGAALGTGAHLKELRRTSSGRFRVERALTLKRLFELGDAERSARLISLAELLGEFPRAELDAAEEARFRNGQALKISGLAEGLCAVYGSDGGVIGLGKTAEGGTLRPLRLTQAAEKHR